MTNQALDICRKWIAECGCGFHPDTRGADYSPPFPPSVVADYDRDMATLFALAGDPYEAAVAAMHERFPDMASRKVANETEVELVNEDGSVEWAGPFADFCASNKTDGLEISRALAVDGEYYGGAGGGGYWHLRMAQAEGV